MYTDVVEVERCGFCYFCDLYTKNFLSSLNKVNAGGLGPSGSTRKRFNKEKVCLWWWVGVNQI